MTALSKEAIAYLGAGGQSVSYANGTPIVRRGDPGSAFYVVMAGRAEIFLVSDEGVRLPLARLGPGASFGEMSVLTGEPVSADVVAHGDVTVLEYPAARFQTALAECAPLRQHILARLCDNLRQTSSKAWGFFQRAQALQALMQTEGAAGPLVTGASSMREVRRRIGELARHPGPILITGEPGTGKLFAARKIHEAARGDGPLMVIDCLRVAPGESERLLFGSADDRRFQGPSQGGGTLESLGALDLSDQGTLVLRHIDCLEVPSQGTLLRYLEALSAGGERVAPRTRVIATSRQDLRDLVEERRLDAALAEQFRPNAIEMPRLAQRSGDIPALARLFLEERDQRLHDSPHHLDRSGEHTLAHAAYRHRNAAELREAVEFAANVAEGPEIVAEHIFTGPKQEGSPVGLDLTPSGPVRWLLKGLRLAAARVAVLVLFAGLAATCLLGAGLTAGHVANALVWAFGGPVLVLLFLLMGRGWCTVCPLSEAGRLARLLGGLNLKPPSWMKNHGVLAAVLLLVAILWAAHVFDMPHQPMATGVLLLLLAGLAVVFRLVYKREAWCRYLCPVGELGAGYSLGAMLCVRASPSVCAAKCTTHECFKGSTRVPGCPVFHHPLYTRDSHNCKLCLNCLSSCPHGSAKLYLRPLLQGLWREEARSDPIVPFALAAFFLFFVMLASQHPGWMAAPLPHAVAAVLAAGVGLALRPVIGRLGSTGKAPDPAAAAPAAFAMTLLGAGPLMASLLGSIPDIAGLRIHAAEGSPWSTVLGPQGVGLLVALQVVAILASAALAMVAMAGIRAALAERHVRLDPWLWRLLVLMSIAYTLAAIALTLRPSVVL